MTYQLHSLQNSKQSLKTSDNPPRILRLQSQTNLLHHSICPLITHWGTMSFKQSRQPASHTHQVEHASADLLHEQRNLQILHDTGVIPLGHERLENILQGLEHDGQPGLEFLMMLLSNFPFCTTSGVRGKDGDLCGQSIPVIGGLSSLLSPFLPIQIRLEVQVTIEIGVHAQVYVAHDAG